MDLFIQEKQFVRDIDNHDFDENDCLNKKWHQKSIF